jgi:hypothetical protein
MVADGIVNFSRYISPEIAAAGLPKIQAARADLRKPLGRYLQALTARLVTLYVFTITP